MTPRGTLMKLTALVALIAVVSIGAAAVGGKTEGDWDLPSLGNNGFASGKLLDQSGNTVFAMDAVLVEQFTPALSIRVGTIQGDLDDGVPGFPVYTVFGEWVATALTGKGTFKANITKQVSPLGPIVIVGKMSGKFVDLPFPPNVGKYEGEWKAVP